MPSYIDFRYPGPFNLNRSAEMPSSFGPPNMSAMFQSGISGLADPIVARMREEQQRADTAKTAADYLTAYKDLYSKGATDTTSAPAAARPQTATTGTPAGDDPGGPMSGVASSQVRDTFMNTVKAGGLTNPYGLAAVAATGEAETSWSPGRLTTAWNDLGKPSGGAMSWRAERLQAMRNFTRGSDNPAEAQAQFFLNEDPTLIARLNQARSPEEANALMARAWRYKGYDGGPEYSKREALTKQYASQLGDPAPAPAPAPQAAFAPTVAPAPTPQAAATVAAPQGPQQAPPRPQPVQTPAPQQGTQQQAQDPQAAMQQQVVSGVEQGDQVINDRLQATRQAGQTRVASLDPSTGIAPRAVPTSREGAPPPDVAATSSIPMVPPAALPRPAPAASAPTAPAGPPVPPVTPAGVPTPDRAAVLEAHDAAVADALRRGDRARADQLSAMRPAIASGGSPGPTGPTAPVTPAPPPVQVAQAAGLPGAISGAQRGAVDPRAAAIMLRNARTPEEVNKIGQALLLSLQPPAPTGNRFDLKHDAKGNWYRIDQLDGTITPVPPPSGAARDPEAWAKEKDLREKFDSEPETRKYRVSQNAYDLVRTHAEAGNGVGDVSLIYAYMKLLDPDTGIREGEFALAGQTGSVPDRIVNVYNNALSGTRLSDKQRKQFVDEAGRALQVRHNQVDRHAGWVRNVARKEKLDPDNILRLEPYQFKTWDPPVDPNTGRKRDDPGGVDPERAANAPGRTPQTAVEVSTDPNMAARQLRQLPAGTWWIGPDGRPRQKGRE